MYPDAIDLLLKKYEPNYIEIMERQGVGRTFLLLRSLVGHAGEIPEETCPLINSVQEGVSRAYDESDKASVHLIGAEDSLESVRKANAQLRALGKFWRKRYDELLSAVLETEEEKDAERKEKATVNV